MDRRLKDVRGTDKVFGGISVLFIGDLFQLKPVMDSYVFLHNNSSAYGSLEPNLWKENVDMIELNEIMRQGDDLPFAELLSRMREGNHTEDDIKELTNKCDKPNEQSLEERFKCAKFLYPTNAQVQHRNTLQFNASTEEKKQFHCKDVIRESMNTEERQRHLSKLSQAKYQDKKNTAQLSKVVNAAISLPYDMCINVDTADGLTNGASCTVKSFRVPERNPPNQIIWVLFDDKEVGKELRAKQLQKGWYEESIDPEWTGITPVARTFRINQHVEVERTQMPLHQSSAKTIHKSQGATEEMIVIVSDKHIGAGQADVAWSRA